MGLMLSKGARLLAEKIGSTRGAQLALRNAFAARGRPIADGLISHWLRGRRRPNIDNIVILQELLGIDPKSWEKPRAA
jgi:transcriptional regulator with XRE-family HTH domain